ncbi:MAG: hypothetical protein Q7R88_03195 [bacterium]|nr:hypothetical protein [bacterium]
MRTNKGNNYSGKGNREFLRVAPPRLEGVVKNRGIKPVRKKKQS